jgi:hypothetical protein
MTLFMETTTIHEARTVADIQTLLARRGATAVLIDYEAGAVVAMSFKLRVDGADVPFRLPCRWPAVDRLLRRKHKRPKGGDTWEAWARRVAWRQILRWVEAQLALIETGMVKTEEVFMPYAVTAGGKTMYEVLAAQKFLALPDRTEPEDSP